MVGFRDRAHWMRGQAGNERATKKRGGKPRFVVFEGKKRTGVTARPT
jgi:hypothetical protein